MRRRSLASVGTFEPKSAITVGDAKPRPFCATCSRFFKSDAGLEGHYCRPNVAADRPPGMSGVEHDIAALYAMVGDLRAELDRAWIAMAGADPTVIRERTA